MLVSTLRRTQRLSLPPPSRLPIQHPHQLRDVAVERVRQLHEHRQAGEGRAVLHLADEGVSRVDHLGERALAQAAAATQLAQATAENDSITLALRHEKTRSATGQS